MIIFHCQTLGGLQEGCGANPDVGRLLREAATLLCLELPTRALGGGNRRLERLLPEGKPHQPWFYLCGSLPVRRRVPGMRACLCVISGTEQGAWHVDITC